MFNTVGFGASAHNAVTFGIKKVRGFQRQQRQELKDFLAALTVNQVWVQFNENGSDKYAYNQGRVIEKNEGTIKVRDVGGAVYNFGHC